ncbi:hypothetical protein C5167_040045 [Papaver somniferum]|uniref:S-protein homolog n=1 Tax=Papaver somniferum TaxID=3469 RepID=A0A4Y7IHA7_PAPSO|nr:hypothetical protein C5167_040045 [Papaver somniferum]
MASFFVNVVLLTILFGFSSLTDGFGRHSDKTDVIVVNNLSPNIMLNLHCKSADDDLGEHSVAFDTAWSWSFYVNFIDTTLYWCNFWWVDNNGKSRQEGFQIYKAKRDMKRCHHYCRYEIRPDGVYGFTGRTEPYLFYKWP